jgi:hypothetical protein
MKVHHVVLTALVLGLAGCDRRAGEAQRLAEERAALERDRAQLAADRAAADRAANEKERARLDTERAALESERAKLSTDRDAQAKAEQNARLAAEREARLTAEKRAADETAARRQAELREQEARLSGERAVADSRAVQTVDFFYDALDPFGDWVEVERYGYAFRPNLARDARWRPYTDGGWIQTDYGWTWRSDEPFGWATYHYGRWTRVPRLGWVWIAGSEWGPAWVSWRRSDDYIGWAPLPPDAWSSTGFNAAVDSYFDIGPGLYVFVGVRDFAEPTYAGHVLAPEQNVTIINKTVNVTNVTYKTVNQQNVIVNNGPEISFVEQRGGRPIQRAKVERMAMKDARDVQPARLQGNVLRLTAPAWSANVATTKPKVAREQVKAEETDRGWEKSDPEAKKKLREQAQREARRAERVQRGEPDTDATPVAVGARREPVAGPTPAPVQPRQVPQPPAATPRQSSSDATPAAPPTGRERPRRVLTPDESATPTESRRPESTPVVKPTEKPTASPIIPPAATPTEPAPPPKGEPDRRRNLPGRAEPAEPDRVPPIKPFRDPPPGTPEAVPAGRATPPPASPPPGGDRRPRNRGFER